jgi:diaminohydroxyphosphoribosylaminopyrimidine deaminase/5-amino-6-(5-phosphoribosylamino)uracil reductase
VFNKYITKKIPFVTAKCAQTLDGKIATSTGDSKWITSAETRNYARKKRHDFDAIMVGINTVLADNPQLDPSPKKSNFRKIVVDSKLQTSLKSRLFEGTKASNVIIATTKKSSRSKREQFIKKGVQILLAPAKGKNAHVDLKWLMKELAKQEISNLLIEGGGRLIGRALKDGLVDKMMIYIAPKIVGDQGAISSIAGLNITKIGQALELKDMKLQKLGTDLLLEAHVVYRNH